MTTLETTVEFGEARRETFRGLADALVPESGDLPAAGAVGVSERWLDRAIGARPDLAARLASVLDEAAGSDPAVVLEELERSDPEGLHALTTIVTGAYYLSPKVRKRIGYPGQVANPPFPDEADYYLEDDILAPVLARPQAPLDHPGDTAIPHVPRSLHVVRGERGEQPDVLVIGAGASGAVAARHFAEAGYSVVCLEQGGWISASEFPANHPEFELLTQSRWSPDPNVRAHPGDYPCETSEADIAPVMYNAVGGSTIHFGAQWTRMRPADFKVRTTEGIGDDWPISYAEMLPYYEQMDVEMGISGTGGDPTYPTGAAPPFKGLPIGRIGRTAAIGMNALGWHWWPAAHAIASEAVGSRPACARRGTCMWGCAEGAKGSTDITLWPEALRHGAKLVTGARVREITVNEQGLATGAIYVDRGGVECFQAASVVVVAANGIGTPRLLLNSVSPAHPDGLANSSGMVGKRLMLHPYMSVLGIYEQELDSWLGPWGTPLLSLQFADTDPSRGFERGAQWDVMPIGGPLMALERYGNLPLSERFGTHVHELVRRTLGHGFDWGIGIEDMAREQNSVTIDPELTDSDGIPAPKIRYRIDSDARANLAFQLERAAEAHRAAGATDTLVTDWSQWGWHLLGTARMGDDRKTSVVDRFGRAHDVENLYVIDGSVFVTPGPQPPTATVAANALRCVEAMIRSGADQKTPV